MILRRLALFVLVSFVAAGPQRAASEESLRVGVIQSLTGIAAEDGKTVVQALQLAAEDLEKSSGTKVELLVEDDQTQPKNSVTAYQKLATQKPDVIIAATWDFTTNAVLPIAERQAIPLFNTSTLPESLQIAKPQGNVFHNPIPTRSEAEPFARFLKQTPGKRLAIVYANNSWGETQRGVYRAIGVKSGWEIVGEVKPATYDENEWRELVPRIKSQKPDVTLLLLNQSDIRVFLLRAREIGVGGEFFASKNAYDAIRTTPNKALFEGLCLTYPLTRARASGEFARRYREAYGEEPRIYADNTYDALFLIDSARRTAKAAGSTISDALRQTRYRGLVGEYRYSPQSSFGIGESDLVCQRKGELAIE